MLWFKVWYNGKWVALMQVVFIIPPRMVRCKGRYGEIRSISCRDSEILLVGGLNAPNFTLNHVATVSIGLARNSPLRSFGSSASRIWESVRD